MMRFLNKLWHGETQGLTSAALVVGFASAASRLVGALRDRVLASTFGAGDALDAYYAAFRVPDFLYSLIILGALSAGFIPVFTEYLQKKEGEAWRLAERVLSVVGFSMGVMCALLALFAPFIVPATVPGFDAEKTQLTVELSRIMFLSPFLLGMSAVMGGVLQATRRFVAFSLAPVFYNLGIILGALFLVPLFGMAGLAWGVVLGAVLHFLVQAVVGYRLGLRHLAMPSIRHPGVRRILALMAPRTLGLAVAQVNTVIFQVFSSTLSAGSLSVSTLAMNLQSFPVGIIGVSYAIAAFPMLSRAAVAKNDKEFLKHLNFSARKIIFLILPATALFFLLRPQIVRLILGAGNFDWDDTIRTADVLSILLVSLIAQCFVALLARAFYALQDTKTPLLVGVISEIANFVVAFLTYRSLGIQGLSLAFTFSSFVNALLLWYCLRRRFGSLDEKSLLPVFYKTLVSSLMIIGVGYLVRNAIGTIYPLRTFWQLALQAAVTSVAALASFVGVGLALRTQELRELLASLSFKLFRHRPEVQGAEETHDV